MSSPPTGAARKRGAAASATTPRSTLGAPSAGLEPTPEPHRAYLDDPPSRPSRSTLGAPRRGRELRDERFRREVFDLFEGARSLLSRWSLARFLREWKSRDRTKRAPAEVITIPTDATVGDALSLLARENILSAPVVDADRLRVRARRRDARRPHPDPPGTSVRLRPPVHRDAPTVHIRRASAPPRTPSRSSSGSRTSATSSATSSSTSTPSSPRRRSPPTPSPPPRTPPSAPKPRGRRPPRPRRRPRRRNQSRNPPPPPPPPPPHSTLSRRRRGGAGSRRRRAKRSKRPARRFARKPSARRAL